VKAPRGFIQDYNASGRHQRAPRAARDGYPHVRFSTPSVHARARDPPRWSDRRQRPCWAPKRLSVPKSTRKERNLRTSSWCGSIARTHSNAGIPRLLERFRSMTENRGVPGSSPGLATCERPASAGCFFVSEGLAKSSNWGPEGPRVPNDVDLLTLRAPDELVERGPVRAVDALLELGADVHRHLRVGVADLAHDPLDVEAVGQQCDRDVGAAHRVRRRVRERWAPLTHDRRRDAHRGRRALHRHGHPSLRDPRDMKVGGLSSAVSGREPRMSACVTYRSDLNAARTSPANKSGSSHAAKWPPLSTSWK
jgi:hypothetical protein